MDKILIRKKDNNGFTLLELYIVLVIIGLIVTSVLVGQDLIRQAELRSTVSQYDQFNGAVQTFLGKYGGLPGDVAGNTNFGFVGNGDGDGVIDQATVNENDGERVFFWNHLGSSGAAMIPGTYSGDAVTAGNINTVLPAADAGNYWGVFSASSTNYYLVGFTTPSSSTLNLATSTNTLTPVDALSLDSKLDDGLPNRGLARARGASNTAPDTAASSSCVTGGAYVTTNDTVECTMRIRM